MKALITVASKHGSTVEMARAIAGEIDQRGIEAVLLAPEKITTLEGFDAVVVGSGIYSNKVLPAMAAFCYRWGEQLPTRPVYLFCSGPLDASAALAGQLPYEARHLGKRIGARSVKLFGGCMELSGLRPVERALMRMSGVKAGDYRDWDSVRRWAESVADDLLTGRSPDG